VVPEGLQEILDTGVSEGDDFTVIGSIDPDHTVLGIHGEGKLMEELEVFAEIIGYAIDGGYAMHLVDVHPQAPEALSGLP
jgi:hypothetical protein